MTEKNFAIVRIKNSQFKVSENDEIIIDHMTEEPGKKLVLDDVLLVKNGGKVLVGKPTVSGASIDAEVVEQLKDEKVDSRIYKAKSRYRRHTGHRTLITKLKINKINLAK